MDWQDRYAAHARPFGDEPNAFVRFAFTHGPLLGELGAGSRVLCPGDGYGRNGMWIAGLGHDVAGIELVAAAVQDARREASTRRVEYRSVVADLSRRPYPTFPARAFDVVVSVWFRLPERSSRVAWNQEACRVVRGGGTLLVVTGARVTDASSEIGEWPAGLRWSDHSTDEEIRLLGALPTYEATSP